MKISARHAFISVGVLLPFHGPASVDAATITVSNCADLETAAEMTQDEDVIAEVPDSALFFCGEELAQGFLTLKVKNNRLTVTTSPTASFTGFITRYFDQVRFEVTSSGELVWELPSTFYGGSDDVDLVSKQPEPRTSWCVDMHSPKGNC